MTPDTALTPHSPAAVPDVARMTEEEMQEYGDLAVSFPLLKFDGRDGSFTFMLTEQRVENPELYVLAFAIRNILFMPLDDQKPGYKHYCRADDGHNGIVNPALPEAKKADLRAAGCDGPCIKCSKLQWGDLGEGKRKKPECDRTVNLLVVEKNLDAPMVLSAKRASGGFWEKYLNGFRIQKIRPFATSTLIDVACREEPGRRWYEMHPKRGTMLPAEVVQVYLRLKMDLQECFQARAAEVVSSVGTADEAESGGLADGAFEEYEAAARPLPF